MSPTRALLGGVDVALLERVEGEAGVVHVLAVHRHHLHVLVADDAVVVLAVVRQPLAAVLLAERLVVLAVEMSLGAAYRSTYSS